MNTEPRNISESCLIYIHETPGKGEIRHENIMLHCGNDIILAKLMF